MEEETVNDQGDVIHQTPIGEDGNIPQYAARHVRFSTWSLHTTQYRLAVIVRWFVLVREADGFFYADSSMTYTQCGTVFKLPDRSVFKFYSPRF